MTETINLKSRTKIFNFINKPPLGNPTVVLVAAGFGSIIRPASRALSSSA